MGAARNRARRSRIAIRPTRRSWLASSPSRIATTRSDAIAAAKAAQPEWAAMPAPKRGEVLYRGRQHPRVARRSGGARDDARGRQDAARGARRSRPRDQHPALLRRRRRAARRPARAIRARSRVHPDPAAPARRRRADHAVELPDRDPGVEDRARADRRQRRRPEAVATSRRSVRCGWSRRSTKPA